MAQDLELRHLRVFVAVVEHGGVSRAARALGISQSTASESLAALERALGERVLARGRGLRLTTVGEALLPSARDVIAAAESARAQVAAASTRARDVVAIGTNASVADVLLPPVLAALRAELPNVRYEVTTAVCTAVREGVADGRHALGLVVEPERADDDASGERLARARLVLFGRAGHPLAGRGATPGTIVSHPIYLSDAAGSFTGVMRRYLAAAGFATDRLLSMGSVEGVRRAVEAEPRALGLLPLHSIADRIAAGAVAEVTLSPPLPDVWLKALLPDRDAPPRAGITRLVGALRDSHLH